MAEMKIGFAKTDITPPVGTELGGYAGYRPCAGVHDPLHCRAVVLEQNGSRYALVSLELMCVDEALYHRIAEAVAHLGISRQRLLACAIHTHAAPQGSVPGEGPLDGVNNTCIRDAAGFTAYMMTVVAAAAKACEKAAENLESFRVRSGRGIRPRVGSNRHTGGEPGGDLAVIQVCTESGRNLILYNFPCHPTVLSADNLLASADLAADVEGLLGADMAVFLNGAAGDISTRFTRRESSFAECRRMGEVTAAAVEDLLRELAYEEPAPLVGLHTHISLEPRQVQEEAVAREQLEAATARWQAALNGGEDPGTVRILKSYVEGAGVNLEFAQTLRDVRQLDLPVTVFRFCGLDFLSVPGELFSPLQPEGVSVIAYANGYYRYIGGKDAYDAGCYEAMAAILARGQGEVLMEKLRELLLRLKTQ